MEKKANLQNKVNSIEKEQEHLQLELEDSISLNQGLNKFKTLFKDNEIMPEFDKDVFECLIFEDSYTGVLASNNAGIEVVNIYDKYADLNRDKINESTDYSINNYKEFIDLVNYLYLSVSKDEADDLEF